tara:strand:+ start:916 stop:1134 length:219 start_codon:yes stop_codon:yes gene_type:complete
LCKKFAFFFFFFFSLLSLKSHIVKKMIFDATRENKKKIHTLKTLSLDDDKTLIKEDHTKNHTLRQNALRDSY